MQGESDEDKSQDGQIEMNERHDEHRTVRPSPPSVFSSTSQSTSRGQHNPSSKPKSNGINFGARIATLSSGGQARYK